VPICGLVVVHIAFGFVVAAIWADLFNSAEYARATGIISVSAVSLTHWNLASLPRLPVFAWSLYPALVAVNLALALILSAGLVDVIELEGAWWRVLGVLSILLAFGTVALPIAQRLGRRSAAEMATRAPPERVAIFCPRCDRRQKVLLGSSDCVNCGLEIRIEIAGWNESAGESSGSIGTIGAIAPARFSAAGPESREPDTRD